MTGELDAETGAAITEYEEWAAAGRPGELTHEEAMARLIDGRRGSPPALGSPS